MDENDNNDYFKRLKETANEKSWNINYGYIHNDSAEKDQKNKSMLGLMASLFLITGCCYYIYKHVYKPIKNAFYKSNMNDIIVSLKQCNTENTESRNRHNVIINDNFGRIDRNDPDFVNKFFKHDNEDDFLDASCYSVEDTKNNIN